MRPPLLVALLVGVALGGCNSEAPRRSVQEVRLATGYPTGGAYYPLGNALARLYNQTLPTVHVVVESTSGSAFNVNALLEGSADLAFALSDTAYRAHVEGAQRDRSRARLRGVAVMFQSVLHVVVRGDSARRKLADLKHARIGFGSPGVEVPRTVTYADLLVASGAVTDVIGVRASFDDLPKMLVARDVDAWLIMSGLPLASFTTLARDVGVRFVEIEPDAASRIRAQYPFYKRTIIPAGTYDGQDEPIRTVSVDNLLVCREDLDEDLVYRLTKTFFENLARLAQDQEVAMQVDPDLAPATPIPLHPGAARYYRERELLR